MKNNPYTKKLKGVSICINATVVCFIWEEIGGTSGHFAYRNMYNSRELQIYEILRLLHIKMIDLGQENGIINEELNKDTSSHGLSKKY